MAQNRLWFQVATERSLLTVLFMRERDGNTKTIVPKAPPS